jgi:hypothetical protein
MEHHNATGLTQSKTQLMSERPMVLVRTGSPRTEPLALQIRIAALHKFASRLKSFRQALGISDCIHAMATFRRLL